MLTYINHLYVGSAGKDPRFCLDPVNFRSHSCFPLQLNELTKTMLITHCRARKEVTSLILWKVWQWCLGLRKSLVFSGGFFLFVLFCFLSN